MCGEGQSGLFFLRTNTLRFTTISAVFGREHVLALLRVEVAVRPAEVVAAIDAREDFRKLSHVSGKAAGSIVGLGLQGYTLAIEWFSRQQSGR